MNSERAPGGIARVVARAGEATRRRPWRSLEIVIGVVVLLLLVTKGTLITGVFITAVWGGASSLLPLLRDDTAGTAWSLFLGLGRMALVILPCVILVRSVPRHRWLWLIPLLSMLVIISSPLSLTACATIDRWLLLFLLSAVAAVLVRRRFLRWSVVLPFVVLWEVVPSHGLLMFQSVGTGDRAYRERLITDCTGRAGTRPVNLTADHLMPYHGINWLGGDLVFLGGEGPEDGGMRGHSDGRLVGSWWMRRTADGFRFEQPSRATGNLWRGCLLDGTLWMARGGRLLGAKRRPDGDAVHEDVYEIEVPSKDMDFLDAECDPNRGRIYVTEYLKGGLWEAAPDGTEPRRYQIGGGMLMPRRRFDGKLLVTNSAELAVFAPGESRVIDRTPVALATLGFEVCAADGSIAVADLAGRLRVFEIDDDGRYRFAWGVSLFAPRRVAYSPDCSRIAVTSADDHRVYMIDTIERRIVDVFTAGPALREVAATGPREFSVSDVCSMTTYRW